MLDPAGLAPTAVPRPEILDAVRVNDSPFVRVVLVPVDGPTADGPGLRAERNASGGYHVGRRTLVSVNGGPAIPFERFTLDRNGLSKAEKRSLLADLIACGTHRDPDAGLTVSVVAAPEREVSEARMSAEAELARLDAPVCQLGEVRRRYATDTACNAWSLEQAAKDVARAAEAAARAFAARAEFA